MNELQSMQYDILKSVVNIFNKHNLNYFATGGTCIGAVRHNGFIPWDDDIDIAMPRSDYELFRTKYYLELPDSLDVIDGTISKTYSLFFMKVYNKKSTFVEEINKDFPENYYGVFIDIFPVDFSPGNNLKGVIVSKKFDFLAKCNHFIRLNFSLCEIHKHKVKYLLKKTANKLFKYDYFLRVLANYGLMCQRKYKDYCFFLNRNDLRKYLIPASCFEHYSQFRFEELEINVPGDYDLFLKLFYGEYMKLPPESERVNGGHRAYIIDLNNSFLRYKENNSLCD